MENMPQTAQKVFQLIDLTSLNNNDNDSTINALCEMATNQLGVVAAICIYPQFIKLAKKYFLTHAIPIKIATVTNFPNGTYSIEKAIAETSDALELGADEIDIVFPYQELISTGNHQDGAKLVRAAKDICGKKTLKVIIESGMLDTSQLIERASQVAIDNGADFIKTSTGKVEKNATLDAAKVMLNTLKKSGVDCGFKASGGIKTLADAKKYLDLAEEIMGNTWVNRDHFRFGASSLVNDIVNSPKKDSSSIY